MAIAMDERIDGDRDHRAKRAFRLAALAAACALGVAACSSTEVVNKPLAHVSPTNTLGNISDGGYRRASLATHGASNDLFVALAFSGGGKRSAAFSYGVLRGLRDYKVTVGGTERRLLDELSTITSVSGGSFTSAYYGLHRERIFTDFEADFLKQDIEAYMWGIYLLPWNWDWAIDPYYGTNDMMAEIYDKLMFRGATYANLQLRGRPLISVNATDIGNGSVFQFTQDQFDLICSDLSSYPLARAVAASNGFPVLFTPITLHNFSAQCGGRAPAWLDHAEATDPLSRERYLARIARLYLDPAKTQYVHLMDGGIADNLAMRSMINTFLILGDNYATLRGLGGVPIRRVVVISADGQAAGDASWPKQRTIGSLGQIFSAVSGTQIDSYNFETSLLARANVNELVDLIRRLRCEAQPVIDGHRCDDVEGYFVHLSLADIADPTVRERLQKIPTGLTIPPEDVDTLVSVGETLVRGSPELAEFRRSLQRPGGQAANPTNRGARPAPERAAAR
jgi:NTE family protein